jgi:NAD-dependent SIR2 family protein deacetylase
MPTINVKPGEDLLMQEVADTMGRSKKVVVVTGAGISTNCGIPVSSTQMDCYPVSLLTSHRTFARKMGCTH